MTARIDQRIICGRDLNGQCHLTFEDKTAFILIKQLQSTLDIVIKRHMQQHFVHYIKSQTF